MTMDVRLDPKAIGSQPPVGSSEREPVATREPNPATDGDMYDSTAKEAKAAFLVGRTDASPLARPVADKPPEAQEQEAAPKDDQKLARTVMWTGAGVALGGLVLMFVVPPVGIAMAVGGVAVALGTAALQALGVLGPS
jgi:hypothetical protein